MTDERQACPRCGKPRKQEKQGSITQWITTCSCLAPEEAELENVQVVPVCQKCGKRVSAGRSGSFTQWVFRSDLCSCEKPDVVQVTAGSGETGEVGRSFQNDQEDQNDEPELTIDPNTFPVDRYKPIAQLDKGASGVVYLSRDRLLGTKVAVKCLRALSAEQLIAFQNEARATSKLNHENIVKVLNFGATDGGAPYMVMEYIAGITLKDFIEKYGPLPLPLAISVFTQICDALGNAHAKEIFHRDLKSSNFMLVQTGSVVDLQQSASSNPESNTIAYTVKVGHAPVKVIDFRKVDNLHAYLIDFGVAMVKHATQEPTIVQGNTVVGTPSYMPPDQSIGQPYDQRSEIYALGCVMFEALSGEVPFSAETAMEVISMHASQPAPLLSEVNEKIEYPQELEAIVAKCLKKDPNERFQSVDELSNALAEVGEEIDVALSTARAQTRDDIAVAYPSGREDGTSKLTILKKVLIIASISLLVVSIGAVSLSQVWEKELKPSTSKKRLTKRQKLEKEFAEKFNVTNDSKITTVENNIRIDDDDLRLISDITPKAGTELAIELKTSPALTGRKLKSLPANIASLDLYNTGITDEALKDLGTRAELRQLGLVRTSVSKEGLKNLSLPGLHVLDLSYCHNIDDDAVKVAVNNWPDLIFLALAETKITSQSIKYVKRLTKLKTLTLNGTPVTDHDIERISKLPALEELGITNTEVTEKGLYILATMPQLHALGLVGSLNIKEPAILNFMKRRPDVTVRGRSKQEVVDFYFSPEGDVTK